MVVVLSETNATTNTTNGPGSEDDTVKGSNVVSSEHVGKEGRNGSETSSITCCEDPHGCSEASIVLVFDQGGKEGHDHQLDWKRDKEDDLTGGGGIESARKVSNE